ncbi:N,N-dimethylformamidase beta subunit family domain-containing protein [Nocardioides kongjuensis]|uniref:N,N-dimethylformamidase n=1 Tax=Nocardioides kongjuensis TaxID=349522 RepID=A0A852R871_9ACTN|nr:N,N-dimethylformamidase beta subunit family domain-containing protein [Nocardioides kongjuensis]NYD31093.1 N,N-dimethylformamidase [Nocardioides kongjuensis]
MNVIGYTDRLTYRAGNEVHCRISTTADSFTARLVRLLNGDPHPLGPGIDIRPVPSRLDGLSFPGRVQALHAGSHVVIEESLVAAGADLELSWWARPTLARASHDQAMVTLTYADRSVVVLGIDSDGRWRLDGDTLGIPGAPVDPLRWYEITLRVATSGSVSVTISTEQRDTESLTATALPLAGADRLGLVFAARAVENGCTDHFNGRIESPRLAGLAAWDFGPTDRPRTVDNRLGSAFQGRAVNFPLRACLGHRGAGDDADPRLSPESYQAIHFHDDDLDDALWQDDLVLALPHELPSAVYGVEVTAADGTTDTLPFVVAPTAATAPALLVLPTFSYLAYSCEHVMADPGARAYLEGVGITDVPAFGGNRHDRYLLENGLRSLYDVHTDLTGVCFTSTRKPLPNIRHDHRWAAVAGGATSAHQFSADLHIVAWLVQQGFDVDVAADEDVHERGLDLLGQYRVVLTGSHPEYPTTPMLRAYESYLDGGGRLMYLGGNGFYWVTSIDPEEGHTIEIRRTAGIRAWQPEPGEWHHLTTGELGGLWRTRGIPPQRIVGVGMASQGFDTNRPYDVLVDVEDPRCAFVFDGVELVDGRLGEFDSMVNGRGAAGVEIDRADHALGTSPDALVLASATGFSRAYGLDPIEVALPDGCYDGTTSDKVRADLVLEPKPRQGAVFATSSIAWSGSLLVNGGDNNVSRVTRNVLDAFLTQDVLPFNRAPRD